MRHKDHSLEVHQKWSISHVSLLSGRVDMARCVALWPFLAPTAEMPVESTLKFYLLTVIFVIMCQSDEIVDTANESLARHKFLLVKL